MLRDRIAGGMAQRDEVGNAIYELIRELYPLCRSITGNGVRESFNILRRYIPLEVHEVPSGTKVFDWTVPKEWNIRDAYIKTSSGDKVVDFKNSNLHVVSYSAPVNKTMPLAELRPWLHTLPDHPDWIPYRTSYYNESWGFCLSHNQLLNLKDGEYEVVIDSTLADGHLTYGEYYCRGATQDEVLFSTHICHPSLCNDNLSGIAIALMLAQSLSRLQLRYSYRFIFSPGLIGSITWLCVNEAHVSRIKHGLILACVGDPGNSTYKKSRQGNAEIDKAVAHVLKHSKQEYEIVEFFPYGYDERQFCSPGFNLPMGCLMRTPHGQFPEYHTSADDLSFVSPTYLEDSFFKCLAVLDVLEGDRAYLNQNPKCEPQLGKRGLYRPLGGEKDSETSQLALLWVLNMSDGQHTLLDIAERAGLEFGTIKCAADCLVEHGLLKELGK